VAERLRADVIVVGAGPGGTSAAYWLASRGVDVLLVDKAGASRDKPCGGSLTPRALGLLADIGVSHAVEAAGTPFDGIRFVGVGGRQVTFGLGVGADGRRRRGCVVRRRVLDELLKTRAGSAGARLLAGFLALGIRHAAEPHAVIVDGLLDRKPVTVEAKLLVVATGANRALLESAGPGIRRNPAAIALRCYLGVSDVPDGVLEIHLDPGLALCYAWNFRVSPNVANVGIGARVNGRSVAMAAREIRRAFGAFLGRSMPQSRLLCAPGMSPIFDGFPDVQPFGPALMLVGEAAGLVEPLTGEGISFALESGRLAAEVACECLAEGDLSESRLAAYGHELHRHFSGRFARSRKALGMLDTLHVTDALLELARFDPRLGEEGTLPDFSLAGFRDSLESRRVHELPIAIDSALGAYGSLVDQCRLYVVQQVRSDALGALLGPFVERGKYLRALLVFLGCRAAGGDPSQVVPAAAAIELVHAASLIHDDIMDGATTRRGLPCLHLQVGRNQAIVCGDYLIVKAFRVLAENRAGAEAVRVIDALAFGSDVCIRTCAGQQRDLAARIDESFTEETYLEIARGKTAACIAGALTVGALLAGGSGVVLDVLARYGDAVGCAYQIRDDIMDLTGEEPVSDRRLNLSLVHAWHHGDAEARRLVTEYLNDGAVTLDQVAALVRATGSIEHAEERARDFAQQAVEAAAHVPDVEGHLVAFANLAVARNR